MGIGTSVSTAVSERTAVIIEDYMFDASTAGELQPEESPSDFHDTWDLDGTDFTPEASPDDEGYWDDFENIVLNHNYEELGSELITNGDFSTAGTLASDTYSLGWVSPDSGSSISSGVLNIARVGDGGRVYASNGSSGNLTITSGKTYQLTYTITENNDEAILAYHNGAAYVATSSSVPGTYTITYVAAGTIFLFRNNSVDTTIKIDNVSIKQVDPNDRWALDSGWSIEDGKLKATSTALEATQTNVFTPGNTYEITFTVDSIASGSVKVKAGTTLGSIRSSAGTYTQIFDVAFGTSLVFDMHASGTCVIDNVSVKEYAITPLDV